MTTVTFTRMELIELWNNLSILADIRSFKLGYAVARTKNKIKSEIEILENLIKPDEKYKEYEEKRQALCLKYAQKDEQGEPLIKGNQFIFGDNFIEFTTRITPLTEEYIKDIINREKQVKEYNEFLKENISIEIYQVVETDIPGTPKYKKQNPDSTDLEPTVSQMGILYYFLKDENE